VFTAVSHAHAGVYKSVIANKVGKATCYAHLYVTGKEQRGCAAACCHPARLCPRAEGRWPCSKVLEW